MKPIFAYKDWETEKPDFDHPETWRFTEDDDFPLSICPEPTCMLETDGLTPDGPEGPVFYYNAVGAPSGVAVPCPTHADFEFTKGWHERLSTAANLKWVAKYGQDTWTCSSCGEEYDTFLWGWYMPDRCPECTYQQIKNPETAEPVVYAVTN